MLCAVMSPRLRRAASLCALVLLIPALPGCAPEAPVRLFHVVARLGAEPVLEPSPGETVAYKLDTLTRNALSVPLGTSFETTAAGAERLDFSIAVAALPRTPGSARFRIEVRAPDGWAPLFEREVAASRSRWTDHRVELGGAAEALRFSVEAVGGVEGSFTPLWGSIVLSARSDAAPAPRNAILIVLDTLGAAYLSAFEGAPGLSPRIDRFFGEGFTFRRAYAQYGNTLVSHASLFSGLYPQRHGIHPGGSARRLTVSMVAELARAGWYTAAFTEGAFVSAGFGFATGFDAYDDGMVGIVGQTHGDAAQTFARAGAWLEERAADERFFLFVHTYEVHSPYLPRDAASLELAGRLTPGDDRVFTKGDLNHRSRLYNRGKRTMEPRDLERLRALYSAEIHYLDGLVGAFLDRIDALRLADDTLVVLTADHGDQFGEHGKVGHGESLHNRVLHVPLGFRGPGVVPGHSDVPVQLVDVMPTLLALLGLPAPADADGRSLAQEVRGGEAPPRPAFSEQRSSPGECRRLRLDDDCRLDRFAVQTERFKLVTSDEPPFEHLYDLRDDPLETRDVAAAHPSEARRHRAL
ncbi:MAG: sulfatase, partial [Planctomycetota bacterium]